MRFVIPGGSGQVGTVLARAFHARGDDVVVLSRRPTDTPWRTVAWDGENPGPWTDELEGADVVINLAGRSVDCRYHDPNRRLILGSRVDSTRAIGAAIAAAAAAPRLWLQSSTATIYADSYHTANDEATGVIGGNEADAPDTWRFSVEVAKAWEAAMDAEAVPRTRKVKMRSAMIMSPDRGGVFETLLGLVRKRLGGRSGHGRQYVSWIHDEDFIRVIDWLIEHEELEGAVNICSPHPLPNAEFMRALREAWGIRLGLPTANWMLEIGAFFLRTETELILKSRRVIPGRLTASGFMFDHPTWPEAAKELVGRWREARTGRD